MESLMYVEEDMWTDPAMPCRLRAAFQSPRPLSDQVYGVRTEQSAQHIAALCCACLLHPLSHPYLGVELSSFGA